MTSVPPLDAALDMAARTDAGRIRSHNEDAVLTLPAIGVAVLADGMGGYNAGEVASGMTTALLGEQLGKAFAERAPHEREGGRSWVHQALEREIVLANEAVYQAAQSQPQYAGMGTTLVAAVFFDNRVAVAHVGDSRLYRLRGDEFRQLTRDHSLLQEQLDSGMITAEQARFSQNKNLVTRAVGVDPAVEADISEYPVQAGDIYLLCSDGLNDMVDDGEIALTLSSLAANLELCASQLVDMANDSGGRDNISVILVRVKQAFPSSRSWWARLLAWFK